MNKKDIMRQSSMEILLEEMVKHKPGITSQRLYDTVKEWAGKHFVSAQEFDDALSGLRDRGYRVTNCQWYPAGYVAEPKLKGPPKEDPRHTRMDW